MKKLFFTIALAFVAKFSFGQTQVMVRGYVKTNGTYVQPHHRTSPNSTVQDNWSTYPNVNPYTGSYRTKSANTYVTTDTYSSYTTPVHNGSRGRTY